jgi:hypothetical protein
VSREVSGMFCSKTVQYYLSAYGSNILRAYGSNIFFFYIMTYFLYT